VRQHVAVARSRRVVWWLVFDGFSRSYLSRTIRHPVDLALVYIYSYSICESQWLGAWVRARWTP
jgi:hypothetical protein